jgi:hypothetical protein
MLRAQGGAPPGGWPGLNGGGQTGVSQAEFDGGFFMSPEFKEFTNFTTTPPSNQMRWSWQYEVLPYMDQQPLYERYTKNDFGGQWNWNRKPWVIDPATGVGNIDTTAPDWQGNYMHRQAPAYMMCPSNPTAPVSEPVGNGLDRYAITSYFTCAGFRSYPRCSLTPGRAGKCYHATMNPFKLAGMFNQNERIPISKVSDGLSNTIMLAERKVFDPYYEAYGGDRMQDWGWTWFGAQADCFLGTSVKINQLFPKMAPPDSATKDLWEDDRMNSIGSMHPQGAHVAMGDGSVRFLNENISVPVFVGLGSRANNEVAEAGTF